MYRTPFLLLGGSATAKVSANGLTYEYKGYEPGTSATLVNVTAATNIATATVDAAGFVSFTLTSKPPVGNKIDILGTQRVSAGTVPAAAVVPPVVGSPFTFANLPAGALLANWDATVSSSLVLAGSAVSSWSESVSSLTLAQATTAMKPAFSATGWDGTLPALTFDGSQTTGFGDILTTTAALADRMWVFALVERSAANQGDGAGSLTKAIMTLSRASDNVYSQFGFIRPTSDAGQALLRMSAFGDGTNLASAGGGMPKGSKGLVFGDMGRLIQNNSAASSPVSGSGSGTRTELSLGGSLSADHNRAAFKVAQIVIVNPLLLKGDGADNQKWVVEGYLAHRWNLQGSLPLLHPFRDAPPTSADWTGRAREIVTWGNSLCNGFSPSIPSGWPSGSFLKAPPLTNGGVGGETSTQIRARFDAADPRLHECIVIIGEMYENGNGGGANPPTREHIDHMVQVVLAAGGYPIVLDRHIDNTSNYDLGTALRNGIDAENASLLAAYPDNFLNVSEFVRQLGAPGGIYEDPINFGKGRPPAQAMRTLVNPNDDTVHYADPTYSLIGGTCIPNFIKSKGLDR